MMDKSDSLKEMHMTKETAKLRIKYCRKKKKRTKCRNQRPGKIEHLYNAATLKASEAECFKSTNAALKQRLDKAITEQKRVKRLAGSVFHLWDVVFSSLTSPHVDMCCNFNRYYYNCLSTVVWPIFEIKM